METMRRAKDIRWGSNTGLVVSKQRVDKNAEVYTPREVVEFMWVSSYTESLKVNPQKEKWQEYWYIATCQTLEPCCGSGNFLESVLRSKLKFAIKSAIIVYKNNWDDIRAYSTRIIVAVMCSLYALELMGDNVEISRARCYLILNRFYKKLNKKHMPYSLAKQIAYLLRLQIQQQDTLSGEYCYPFYKFYLDDIELIFKQFCYKTQKGGVWLYCDRNKKWTTCQDKAKEPQDLLDYAEQVIEPFRFRIFDFEGIYKLFKEVESTIDRKLCINSLIKRGVYFARGTTRPLGQEPQ